MADPYGTDVALTVDGDLAVTPSGALATVSDAENVKQALRMRMLTTPGELQLHPEYGSNLKARLVGSKMDPILAQSLAQAELRTLIEEDDRFVAATEISVRTSPDQPNVEGVSVTLELAGGEQLQVTDLANPRPDEIDFASASMLTDLADDGTIAIVDGDAFADVQDDLPELAEFIGEGSATETDTVVG